MKYRIIEERDLNSNSHFEIELWKKTWFKHKWVQVQVYNFHGFYRKKIFSSREDCLKYLNSLIKNRTVVYEGYLP